MTEEQQTLGDYIAAAIRLQRLSINQAAKRAGVPRETLSRIVNDIQGLGPDVAAKIAPVIGISADRLLAMREADAETRRGFDRRLRELEAEVAIWQALLLEALGLLGLQVTRAEDQALHVRRASARPRRASGAA